MTGNNLVDRSKLGTKRHILTDKNGIPLSAVITSANKHDIKAVTDVIDNSVPHRPFESSFSKKKTRRQNRQQQHLCLDRAYSPKSTENEIINRGYVPHIPYKRKRGQIKKEKTSKKQYSYAKNKRWVVERTNSWHNRFRKLFTRYEKKVENYLGLVQLSCSIIIYRKIILG
jgi:transposase